MAFRTPGSIQVDSTKTLQPIIDKWTTNGTLDSSSQRLSRIMDQVTPGNSFSGSAAVDLYFNTPTQHSIGESKTITVTLIPTGSAPIVLYTLTTTNNTWTGTSTSGGYQYLHVASVNIPVADYSITFLETSNNASAAGDPVSVSLSLSGQKLQ